MRIYVTQYQNNMLTFYVEIVKHQITYLVTLLILKHSRQDFKKVRGKYFLVTLNSEANSLISRKYILYICLSKNNISQKTSNTR